MKILKNYLLKTYSHTFFPIFLTLYLITSIIFLVKIASLTSVIQINFLELLQLYSYIVPTIIFYTLPVSIFVALSLTIAKLSSEYELIVITSFGFNPLRVIRMILPHLFLATILTLIISIVLIPKAKFLNMEFTQVKKQEAQFNIKESEYGQKFGDWLIYVSKEKDMIYNDIVLFKQEDLKSTFIIAKNADVKNENYNLTLNLKEGKVLELQDSINEIEFKKMKINNTMDQIYLLNSFNDIINYWNNIDKDKSLESKLTFSILFSLFPLVSIFFIISAGYFNPRYDKNYSAALSFIVSIIYVIFSHRLSKEVGFIAIYSIPFIWFFLGYLIYKIRIRPYY